MVIFQNIFVFILGIVFGSFLNVCIYRIPRGESIIKQPSHCPSCGSRLKTPDLIPVASYIFLKGKCRYCGIGIPVLYTVVELVTAAVFLLLFNIYGLSVEALVSIYLMSILACVFFIDIEHRIIPDGLVIAGIVGGVFLFVYNLFKPVLFFGDRYWWNPLLGMVIGSGFLFMVALVGFLIYKTDDALGMGDVKIFIPIGMILGWKLTIIALFTAIISGGITGIVLILLRLKERKSTIPLGPFISLGAFIALVWGWDIINWWYYNFLTV